MTYAFQILVVLISVNFASCTQSSEMKSKSSDQISVNENRTQNEDTSMFNIPFETITGEVTSLSAYEGKVILIVNVASKCGFTKQYAGLEELYRKYKDSGLVVLGFPANNFGWQEPGTNEEIAEFCSTKFDVTFPMMSKVSVKGKNKHPLFVELTDNSELTGNIKWNFSKFLINREGSLSKRFGSGVEPMSDKLITSINELL